MPDTLTPTDWSMYRGTTRARQISVTTGDPPIPFDLTGSTLRCLFKEQLRDADSSAAITKTTADGSIVITDAPNGIATLVLTPTDTRSLGGGAPFASGVLKLIYALRLIAPSGDEEIVALGTLTITDTAATQII